MSVSSPTGRSGCGPGEIHHNGQENVRFDSDVGEYRAVTELGRPDEKYWNSRRTSWSGIGPRWTLLQRKLQAAPTVTVFPAKTQRLQHPNLLVCSVNGFYPGLIEVRWLRDGREEQAGVVSTGLIRNGDWTFQMLVMLETVPRSGEVYTCQVQHPSSSSPVTVEWSETPSDLPSTGASACP
ncbi:hypothetical protein QTO34_001641 [Cnephaeus nilssonii]|uniref:Ig-like domain-containing protein n=1 Tax=Cnephaeus nilssonii TaxID=3371016 RepID=A0AA40HW85_CNENI|nr:hypothetical protein QTO34_001641 [Eptesicus nilssonii]